MGVIFHKMQGSGNDFVLIDNRDLQLPRDAMPAWARAISPRALSVGADGVIFLEEPGDRDADYIWHFYNADGSRPEMCGNASRCAARLALRLGLAGEAHVLGTDAGPIRAVVDEAAGRAKVALTPPRNMALNIALTFPSATQLAPRTVHFVDTGVPHVVIFTDETEDIAAMDIMTYGPALRYHERFAPAGTNANLAVVHGENTLTLRTYERGVEGETLACGTGAAAAGVLAHALGLTGPALTVRTAGGDELGISQEDGVVFLEGPAKYIYKGELEPADLGL